MPQDICFGGFGEDDDDDSQGYTADKSGGGSDSSRQTAAGLPPNGSRVNESTCKNGMVAMSGMGRSSG